MKKRSFLFIAILLSQVNQIFAQDQFIRALEDLRDKWIRHAYPIIAAIVFIVGALLNYGHFFGENRDIKKGITNILVYLGVVVVIGGIFEAIMAISL